MEPAILHMTEDGLFKLWRLAEEFFNRPENRELSKQLAEIDRQEKVKI